MSETAFAAAFAKAKYDTSFDRLALAATNLLNRVDAKPEKAIGRFEEMLDSDRELRRALAMYYLQERAADIHGEKLVGAVHLPREGQLSIGRSHQPTNPRDERGGDVHTIDDNRIGLGIPEQSAADGSVKILKSQSERGPSAVTEHRDGAVRSIIDSQPSHGRPVSVVHLEQITVRSEAGRFLGMPSQAKKNAALRAVASVSNSLFDAYRLQDGVSIGKVHWFELDKRIEKGSRDTALLRMIRNSGMPTNTYATVEEILSIETLETMVKTVSEMSDAA